MRAAVYYRNSDVRLETRPVPVVGPGELLVKVLASGICGSDVLEWYRIRTAPRVLGHEIAGVVEQVGAGVEQCKPGDRVAATHHVPCNTCRYCLAGHHTVCETLHTTSFDPGGFAEYVRIPALQTDRGTFRLPDSVSFEEGTFIEPLGCVVRGQRHVRLAAGQSALVLGSGVSGLLHILLARASGAGRIMATDVNAFRLDQARQCGADHVFDARDDVPAAVRACNDGRGADCVIVCTGAFSAFRQALAAVDRAGTILCFATTEPGQDLPLPLNDFWRNSVTVTSSYAAAPADLATALELIRAKRVAVSGLVTHRLPLAETGEGFRLMADGAEASIKIVVEPQT